jgi:hypothetical protein
MAKFDKKTYPGVSEEERTKNIKEIGHDIVHGEKTNYTRRRKDIKKK